MTDQLREAIEASINDLGLERARARLLAALACLLLAYMREYQLRFQRAGAAR